MLICRPPLATGQSHLRRTLPLAALSCMTLHPVRRAPPGRTLPFDTLLIHRSCNDSGERVVCSGRRFKVVLLESLVLATSPAREMAPGSCIIGPLPPGRYELVDDSDLRQPLCSILVVASHAPGDRRRQR
ncbi:hypothetical protein MRB56_14580 [Halomonas cupida]|uniref:hypothetical protein n=1 Tax=Halomonas cupida TaxID=44933 RepID=UPI0039B41827